MLEEIKTCIITKNKLHSVQLVFVYIYIYNFFFLFYVYINPLGYDRLSIRI